ncbi:MAG: DUF2795 domain-containing protein [Acidimicrobiia bacterium]
MPSVTDIQKALKGARYPASKEELLQLATSNGADAEVIDTLRSADADRLDGPDNVMHALKGDLGRNG